MKEKMRLVVGYDGSSCSDAVLDDLARAGLPPEAEALVVSVAEVWLPPPSSLEIVEGVSENNATGEESGKVGAALKEARVFTERAVERLRARFPLWRVKSACLYGSPASELIIKANEWEADLIIVGSHGRSALGRLVLGSVSQKVLAESGKSVRVARGRIEVEPSPVRILIGVDGSAEAEAAVREVAARIWPAGSEARLVLVDDPLTPTLVGRIIPPVARWVEESNREEREWIEEVTSAAVKVLRKAELETPVQVREGNPKRVLVEEAESWRADTVFLGSTGFGNRFERFLLGSVSAAVAARAHCSVEVVRRPPESEGEKR